MYPLSQDINELKIIPDGLTDDQWLEMIADRVKWFLDNDKGLLLSYMYRLDIDEAKIEKALMPAQEIPAHILLATLILERQKQRMASKKAYKVDPIDGWEY